MTFEERDVFFVHILGPGAIVGFDSASRAAHVALSLQDAKEAAAYLCKDTDCHFVITKQRAYLNQEAAVRVAESQP